MQPSMAKSSASLHRADAAFSDPADAVFSLCGGERAVVEAAARCRACLLVERARLVSQAGSRRQPLSRSPRQSPSPRRAGPAARRAALWRCQQRPRQRRQPIGAGVGLAGRGRGLVEGGARADRRLAQGGHGARHSGHAVEAAGCGYAGSRPSCAGSRRAPSASWPRSSPRPIAPTAIRGDPPVITLAPAPVRMVAMASIISVASVPCSDGQCRYPQGRDRKGDDLT